MTSSETRVKVQDKETPISFVERYALPYYASCVLFIIVWITYLETNEPAYTAAIALCLPYLGKYLPRDSYPVIHSKEHNKNVFQVFPLIANILFTWVTLAKVFIDYPIKDYSRTQISQLVVTLLFTVPASIDASHELIHRPQWGFKILGFLNMALFQFTVYPIEHIYLHHKCVGTSKDPITSPKNQNFYTYTLKAFFSAHKFVFNYNIKYFAICLLTNWFYIGLLFFFAFKEYNDIQLACWKTVFFVGVGILGYIFFQTVEYIEHYGLVYRDDVDKKEVNQISSWNSEENQLQNWIIFRFQRHSDHHMNAYKIYTTLELTDRMPRFPFPFLHGAFLALFPPLWYYIMNPFVDEVIQKKEVNKQHRKITKWVSEGMPMIIFFKTLFDAYLAYSLRSM